ncbi:hypothetical protein DXG03_003890 [Asterophora parasitica]|uniref:Uncharacterized protein n=1 Tax=Asterophora parasitica TaxID=117018 RepID=A0A9P7GCQ6_9AGAR|nr:hypothetical protein DXG03_003890 [Asterophora parasitica]
MASILGISQKVASSLSKTDNMTRPPCATTSILPAPEVHRTSTVRRKPQTTYRSPSLEDSYIIGPFSLTVPQKNASSSTSPQSITLEVSTTPSPCTSMPVSVKRKKYPMGPPLPLYHPLGTLALSLPPLDPASVGLPTIIRSDDAIRRSSARARRPVAKLRSDVTLTVEAVESPTLPVTSPLLDIESRDKPSLRKRRGGGGGKRKRKEVDDGDATYPAKRKRTPRGAANPLAGDEESPIEAVMAEVTPTPEPMSEVPEDKKPERRSTRARGSAKRRDSSASEAASSISTPTPIGPAQERESMEVVKASDIGISVSQPVDEKEEGELSEDGAPTNAFV